MLLLLYWKTNHIESEANQKQNGSKLIQNQIKYNSTAHIKNQMKESLARYKNPSNKIKRLYDLLDSHKVTTISVKKQFLSTTNSIDYVRNESWKQVFPELFKLLNG